MAAAAGEFAQAVSDLAACDVGNQLSVSLVGLAEVERKAQELQSVQATQDVVTVLSTGSFLGIIHGMGDILTDYNSG